MEKQIISAQKQSIPQYFIELVKYKDLFITFAIRDFKVRYSQTTLGLLWAIIQPLITISVLTFVFGRVVKVDTNGTPTILYTLTGTCAWTYFSFVLTNSGNSIISSQSIIKKIYFPRLIIPISKAFTGLIDLFIVIVLSFIVIAYYKVGIFPQVVFLPIFILLTLIAALGIGIWIAALTIRFRDFQQVVPFMVQFGLYISPTAYPVDYALNSLPQWAKYIYMLNPLVGIIQGYRWCMINDNPPNLFCIFSVLFSIILFITGMLYFIHIEDSIADLV